MRLYTHAFKQGIVRIFALPRLSLPFISTLGLTLAAVLTVTATATTLFIRPLPDIDETDLHRLDLTMAFSDEFKLPFLNNLKRVATLQQEFSDTLQWGHLLPNATSARAGGTEHNVTHFMAAAGTPETLGLSLLSGQSSETDNTQQGVWISNSLWQAAFEGAPDVLQQTLQLNGSHYPIFGVFEDFTSITITNSNQSYPAQVWQFRPFAEALRDADPVSLRSGAIAFVKGPAEALPQLEQLEAWYPDYVNTEVNPEQSRQFLLSQPVSAEREDYRSAFMGSSQQLATILLIAVISLLLMACLNLLNLFVAHYQSRSKEFAIQLSLGASVSRLRRLVFMENLPMFLLAALVGLLAAGWMLEWLPVLANGNLHLLDHMAIDHVSVVVALGILMILNIVFACVAVLHVNHATLQDSLQSSGKGTPVQHKQTISRVLMLLQLSLACVLLTGAGALARHSYAEAYQDLGYTFPNAYEVSLTVEDEAWQRALEAAEQFQGSEWQRLRADLVARLAALGGEVVDVDALPLTSAIRLMSYRDPQSGKSKMYREVMWAPNLFANFDIRILAGRDLQTTDGNEGVLITQATAVDMAGDGQWQDLIGQELILGENPEDRFIITGIVENTKASPTGLFKSEAPEVYFNQPRYVRAGVLSAVLLMPDNTSLSHNAVARALEGMDPRLGELTVEAMDARLNKMTAATRLNLHIVLGLAALTLVLAAVGLSGLSQLTAGQKRYELAVRMATGATQKQLLRLLLKEAAGLLVVGLSLGTVMAVVVYHQVAGITTSAPDFSWPATAVFTTILALTMLASVALPSWRVIRKDPMQALKNL